MSDILDRLISLHMTATAKELSAVLPHFCTVKVNAGELQKAIDEIKSLRAENEEVLRVNGTLQGYVNVLMDTVADTARHCGLLEEDVTPNSVELLNLLDGMQTHNENITSALRRLVKLKDHKDEHGKTEEYLKAQPVAWEVAREVLV